MASHNGDSLFWERHDSSVTKSAKTEGARKKKRRMKKDRNGEKEGIAKPVLPTVAPVPACMKERIIYIICIDYTGATVTFMYLIQDTYIHIQ